MIRFVNHISQMEVSGCLNEISGVFGALVSVAVNISDGFRVGVGQVGLSGVLLFLSLFDVSGRTLIFGRCGPLL